MATSKKPVAKAKAKEPVAKGKAVAKVKAKVKPRPKPEPDGHNVALRRGFEQVCVIEGLRLGNTPPAQFEATLGEMLGVRVQYLETVMTLPDRDAHGAPVPDTGGRSDVMFAYRQRDYSDDFNARRMLRNIRWLDDAISRRNNPNGLIYPERIRNYVEPKLRALTQ